MFKKGKRIRNSTKKEQFASFTNFMKTNKRNIFIISSIILAIAIIGTMYAFFSDIIKQPAPVIKAGSVLVRLDEDEPFKDLSSILPEGADTDTKVFRAVSEGILDAYVRAKIIPIVEYFDEEEDIWITTNIPSNGIELEITAPEWTEDNGYYYYKSILLAGSTSDKVTVKIIGIDIPENLKTAQIRATIKVMLEAAQVEYNAWKGIFNISHLPDDVQIAREEANDAKLQQGMIPVIYDYNKNKWVKTSFSDPSWYNYNNGKWANIMLSDGIEYDTDGKTILKMGSMFVWIPRYAYKITYYDTEANREAAYNGGTEGIKGYSDSRGIVNSEGVEDHSFSRLYGKIDIVFLNGNSNKYTDLDGVQKEASDENYMVHPVFRNDSGNGGWDKELTGFWVAKYNASMVDSSLQNINTTSTGEGNTINGIVRTVENNTAWRYVNIDTIFKICRYMEKTDVYGWKTQEGELQADGRITGDNNRIDTHLIKNNEWGAVAYLTEAKGKGTNRSAPKINANTDSAYTTGKGGTGATTTGNEYGIYDLRGCAWEYTAGYADFGNSLNNNGRSLYNASSKYKTVYMAGANDGETYNNSSNKIGEGVFETSLGYHPDGKSWYNEHAYVPSAGAPFFLRGGFYGDGASGVFCFYRLSGAGEFYYSFRPVIVID